MKKSLKIAAYDFRRIMFNPITIVCLVLVLAACLITGFVLKPQVTPAYSADVTGDTTRQVYENFLDSKDSDTKSKLDALITQAEIYINIQKQESSIDQEEFRSINTSFQEIKDEVEKFNTLGSSYLLEDSTQLKNASANLKNFVDRFENLSDLETDLIFTVEQFTELSKIAEYFDETANSAMSNQAILTDIYFNKDKIDTLNRIALNVYTWDCDPQILEDLENEVVAKAKTKLTAIQSEMQKVYDETVVGDIKHLQDMHDLTTNYKLTCESAKFVVETEFKLLLEKRFNNLEDLFHFEEIVIEDTQLALTKAEYFLNDEGLYYRQYQTALNFNTASYQITVYDYTYMIVSIIGFLSILFGIFVTYKLFGRDRKNGKMDTILAQDVTFNQVFVGKSLAVLFITSTVLLLFTLLSLLWGTLIYSTLPNQILAVFNLSNVYTISPILFLFIKVIGIELQVIFYTTITLFVMNLSRKFDLLFLITLIIFAAATVCNIFLNGSIVYCLFPFIHADITSFLGGATMETGFLKTSLYTSGNFFISIAYYLVFVLLLFNFTRQLFKKN